MDEPRSMWVMAASPLLTCNDVRNMSAATKEILTNVEVKPMRLVSLDSSLLDD